MKLFNRTLYFFILVIILQAGLTIFFITNILRRSNIIEVKKELESDVENYKENFYSWKRFIFKILIDNLNDKKLKRIVDNTGSEISTQKKIKEYLRLKYIDSPLTCIAFKSINKIHDFIQIKNDQFLFSDLYKIYYDNDHPYIYDRIDHPYIEVKLINNNIYIIGALRIPSQNYKFVDLFIMKMIDDDYNKYITTNKRSKVAFFFEDNYVSGNIDSDNLNEIVPYLKLMDNFQNNLITEYFNVKIKKISHNLAIQKINIIKNNGDRNNLFLVTLLSNESHEKRLFKINRIVIYVSILSALLSILLSLFLSTNITRPIKNLIIAMHKIKNGKLNTKLRLNSNNEINDLLLGFNDMAKKLYEDKITMNNYIKEITILKNYNEKIINSLRAGIMIINSNFKIDKINYFFLEYFKMDKKDYIGKSVKDLNIDVINQNTIKNIGLIINRKKKYLNEIIRSQDKKIYEIKLYPLLSKQIDKKNITSCVFIIEDISKKIEFEEKIFLAEKLSSISMLSAGIAHEINNPLSSILTNTQNLISEEESEQKKVSLKWIEQETRRIALIVQNLLDFSSSNKNDIIGTNVNEIIPEIIKLINYSIKKENKINIKVKLGKNIPLVVINQDEFKQIIINLIKNSIQAIEKNGDIIVKTENYKNNFVNIYIIDNGIGIKEDVIQYIFDPFYTTKKNGNGTGLGLSIVYGIINKYNGSIKVKSKEGKGATIKITFPVLY